jgi:hypothetical protein
MQQKLDLKVLALFAVLYLSLFYIGDKLYLACFRYAYKDSPIYYYLTNHKTPPNNINFAKDLSYCMLWLNLKNIIVFITLTLLSYILLFAKFGKYLWELTFIVGALILVVIVRVLILRSIH